MFSKLWNSDAVVLLRRIALFFIMMAVCRAAFYIYNHTLIGPLEWGEIWDLMRGALLFDSVSMVYSMGLFIILSLLPFRFREKRWYQSVLFYYFIIVSSLVAILNLADIPYFKTTGIRITAADMMFADNDNTAHIMFKIALEHWYLVLLLAVLIAGMVRLYRRTGKPVTPIRNLWAYTGVNLVILALAGVCCVAIARGGGLSRDIRPITLNNAMSYTFSSAKANLILSNPFCVIRTIGQKGIRYTKYFTPEELEEIYSPYHYPELGEQSDSAGMNKKNVVIFVLESFSAEHSALLNPDLYPDGEGYTPFLDSLMQQGYYFKRAYAGGRKSIAALPSILSSMLSFKKLFVLTPQGLGEGCQLPKILDSEGYSTMFFCGSPHGSMGFDAYAKITGIEQIYDKEDYDKCHPGNDDFDGWWGVWDEPFVGYMGEVMDQSPQPFFSTIFTITSHHPFHVPARYEDKFRKGTTRIHQTVQYTDMAIRKFFETYGDTEWARNTVFVFCADHVSSERWAAKTETPAGSHHIISFIYTPDGSIKGVSDDVFQQCDVMPTVLGLLNYNKPYFAFGRDVFREPGRTPMAVNYQYNFQIITDSLSLQFDEQKTVAVYDRSDTLQQHNILSTDNPLQQQTERLLKAVIQQYYSHLEKRVYLVPEDQQ